MFRSRPIAAVVVFPGSHGDRDLLSALTSVGFAARYHPSQTPLIGDEALVGLPGGFAYGDYWRAGVLGSRARAVRDLPAFIDRGGLCIGVCNGFQILVEAGLLGGALAQNDPPGFVHRWLTVTVTEAAAKSPWFAALSPGQALRLPIAHGEGRYVHAEPPPELFSRVPLRYLQNPNGSLFDAAALLDHSGRVLGVMPHPERAIDPLLGSADGLFLFRSAFESLRHAA